MYLNNYWVELFLAVTILFWVGLHLYISRKFNYWKDRNVSYVPPIPFFGNGFELLLQKKSIPVICRELYASSIKPYVGFFVLDEPCLLIRDLQLIKTLLIKDFGVCPNRTVADNPKDDPVGSGMLFVIKNQEWKDIRKKVTPVFSSGKIKLMYPLIKKEGEHLVSFMAQEIVKDSTLDIRDIAAKFTTNSITSTAFGINANAFVDVKSEFFKVAKISLNWAYFERAFSTTCYFIFPTLVKWFHLKFVDKASCDFMKTAFWKTMSEREEQKVVRNDLLDILINMKNEEKLGDYILEGDKLVAQAVQFFLAGFETTSIAISYTLHELAWQPEIQTKLRREIIKVSKKYGEISFDALKDMEYLDMCLKETLRKYPPLAFLDRRCINNYNIPGTDIILEKGTSIFIPTWGLHMDPQYYPNPEHYDPSRFTEENIKSRPMFSYLPFGDGPRSCIGARYGKVSAKTGLAHIISKFVVEFSEKTVHPIDLDHKGFLLAPVGSLWLKFTPYKDE